MSAIQWTDDVSESAVYEFIRRHGGETRYMSGGGNPPRAFYLLLYPRGEQAVREGDWIVAGLGGLRGYAPEVFARDFEERRDA